MKQTPIDEAARFDKLAPMYDLSILPVELLIGRCRRRLIERAHGDVLEIGIGTARTLRDYPTGIHLTGVDVSGEMLERGRRRAAQLGRKVEFRIMPAERLDFPAASFDAVVSSLVFCSVDEPKRALAEIYRVLKPGGELLMVEHVRPKSWLGKLFDRLDPWFYQQSCHLNRRTPVAVRQTGFNIEEQVYRLRDIFVCLRAVKA